MKIVKYIAICVAAICSLMMLPLTAKAANIVTATANGTASSTTVSGTTEAEVLAVIVQIRDSSDNICTMESFPVTAGTYNVIVNASLVAGEYKAYVADYTGGSWKVADFVVTDANGNGSGSGNGSGNGSGSGSGSGNGSGSGQSTPAGGESNGSSAGAGSGSTGSNTSGNTGSGSAEPERKSPKTGEDFNFIYVLMGAGAVISLAVAGSNARKKRYQ